MPVMYQEKGFTYTWNNIKFFVKMKKLPETFFHLSNKIIRRGNEIITAIQWIPSRFFKRILKKLISKLI